MAQGNTTSAMLKQHDSERLQRTAGTG